MLVGLLKEKKLKYITHLCECKSFTSLTSNLIINSSGDIKPNDKKVWVVNFKSTNPGVRALKISVGSNQGVFEKTAKLKVIKKSSNYTRLLC